MLRRDFHFGEKENSKILGLESNSAFKRPCMIPFRRKKKKIICKDITLILMEDLWICVALFGHWSPTLVIIFTEVYDVFFYFVQLKTNIPGLLILVFHSDKY